MQTMLHDYRKTWRIAAAVVAIAALGDSGSGQPPRPQSAPPPAATMLAPDAGTTAPPSILGPDTCLIDLDSALRLAHVGNPDLMIARERVTEAAALRQLAAAQFLPSINAGTNYDDHNGNLQRSTGQMLSDHRQSLYLARVRGPSALAPSPSPVSSGTNSCPNCFSTI